MVALDCFYPLARDHLQFKELWEPEKHRQTLRTQAPELSMLSAPLGGWKIKEAYLFATTKTADDALPWYETVVVDTTGTLETQARALSKHVTQTGGSEWVELLPRLESRAAVLGAASRPALAAVEWFTRVVNMG